jgi:hypothetical protein
MADGSRNHFDRFTYDDMARRNGRADSSDGAGPRRDAARGLVALVLRPEVIR